MIFEVKEKFKLSEKFLESYKGRQPNWGPLGYVTYKRTYARAIEGENRLEEFWETVKRVVEGCYTVQLNHCRNIRLPWNAHKAQKSAQEMYRLIWEFKFTPPGRGLWAMGADLVWIKGSAALNNCAYVDTKDINFDFSGPFVWLMDMSMFGVGVSFNTDGAGLVTIVEPKTAPFTHVVEDSREGWCEAVRVVLEAYVGKEKLPTEFDFSKIRPAGQPLKTMGGIAPGPQPLITAIEQIKELMNSRIGHPISSTNIVDLMNIIGRCVVSGGVRRTAELALGNVDDVEYTSMKDPTKYSKELSEWRWASNNSVYVSPKMDYTSLAKQVCTNGEPGFVNLDLMRKYGRIKDGVTWKDKKVGGVNPCGEQSLESYELCNLCEVFPSNHDSFEEFRNTLKYAYLYAKTVTLIPTHCERTNQVLLRNRRIGLSLTGIINAFDKFGRREFLEWCDKGYERVTELDKKYSDWLCIPESVKKTTVKPSGTVSLLPGVNPGIHYAHSYRYIRRIRIQITSPMIKFLQKAGIPNEPSKYNDNTVVFSFPVETPNFKKSKNDVTIWEQLENAALIQYYWSDNCVSQTVTVKSEEFNQLADALEIFEDRLKTVSFLPLSDHGYVQAPYEEIDEATYKEMKSKIKKLDLSQVPSEGDTGSKEKFCTNDTCTI